MTTCGSRSLPLLIAATAVGGCEDALLPLHCESDAFLCVRPVLTTAIVSDPGASVAYVSLPPGTVPDAEHVTIRNRRTGSRRTVPMQDGGFDPVSLEAGANDTLDLDVQRAGGGAALAFMVTVPPSRRPIVVRTDPPPRKRDVPLNAMMLVVFSEPINPATLTSSAVQLLLGGAPVAGTLAFGDSVHLTATFTPADSLVGGAEYALRVTQEITDLQGDQLEAPVTVEFWSEPPWGLIVSDPAGATVYASLPPWHSFGERVVIRNRRTGAQATAEMANGGLDPTPIAAGVGDTLEFLMGSTGHSVPFEFVAVVPLSRPPEVVRTDPPGGRRDVPPDAAPLILFSEPIDGATLTDSSVRLTPDSTPLAGAIAFGDAAHLTVTFTPAEALAVGAEYRLLVSPAVADLDGDTLADSVTVGFATGGPPLPPGTQLAFVRDGQIHLVNSDGTGVVRLSDGPDDAEPAWSPDGSRLAFASARGASPESTAIWIMDADGGNLVRRAIALYGGSPSWSPDGQWIAFTAVTPYDSLIPGTGSLDVFVMRADDDGTSPINLIAQQAWDAHPAWSPDGTRIAFVSDWTAYDFTADIYTMAADGSQRTQLTDGFGFDGSLVQYYQPAWSPDGQRIAVVTCRIGFYTCQPSTVSVMNADGSGITQLAATVGWDGATWSPDGQIVAFGSGGSVYWVSADRSALGVIVANGHSPAWRP
jgi:TolB protein